MAESRELPKEEIAPEDIVVLHEVVVEELEGGAEAEGERGAEAGRFEVAEPEEDVIAVEVVERIAEGPPRGGMATEAGIHPTVAPATDLPIEDVPPDETLTPDMVADKSIAEEVVKVEEVTEVTEEIVQVEEVVTVADGEVMETEGEKADKKRLREAEGDVAAKKVKAEKEKEEVEEEKAVEPKKLGPKVFNSGVEMFTYFYNLLHDWNLNHNLNKYEFMVLSELVGQANPQKVGVGIAAFQVRMHEKWQSRCYYLIRKDGSEDDFSYRKCVDALMPLPKSLYRKNGELDLEKLFPGQKGRHKKEQNGHGGRGGGDRGGRGFHHGGRGGRGGRGGGGGRRGGRGKW